MLENKEKFKITSRVRYFENMDELISATIRYNERVPDGYILDLDVKILDDGNYMLVINYKPDYSELLDTIQQRLYTIADSLVN